MDIGRLLAGNVKRLRIAKGWTQEEAAAASGIHPTYWSQIETAKRNISLSVLGRVAQGLAVPVAVLFAEAETATDR